MLYSIYALFLKNDTFFKLNRFYLFASIIFSLLLPLIHWEISTPENVIYSEKGFISSYLLNIGSNASANINNPIADEPSLAGVLFSIYLAGTVFFFLRLLTGILRITKIIRSEKIQHLNSLNIVYTSEDYTPFSFFNIIFLPAATIKNHRSFRQILEHEKVHIRQYHCIDIMLLEILTILQWFNPFIWMLRHSVKSVHEYLADDGVLMKGFDHKEYSYLLLDQGLGIKMERITSNFNNSLFKKRLFMMTKERSGKFSGLKAAIALPAILCLLIAFAVTAKESISSHNPNLVQIVKQLSVPQSLPVCSAGQDSIKKKRDFYVVKTVPRFNGDKDALNKYIIENLKYPEEAKKNNITGKVYVSFIVTKTGKITDVKIVKSANPLFDKEALRVVSSMPDWKPGLDEEGNPIDVRFTLPIRFLQQKEKSR